MARKLAVRLYWMWRKEWDYEQVEEVRFARGTARKSSGCAVNHRPNDSGIPLPSGAGGIMIEVQDGRREGWVELNLARDDYKASLGLVWRAINRIN